MPTITIEESGCRDCHLCIDVCPVDVLEEDKSREIAVVARQDDCIGCTSCEYMCPSRCITISDYPAQRPFYRIEENAAFIARFLQRKPVAVLLTPDDFKEALTDVGVRLAALGDSVMETMGRGHKAAGRKAGQLAAAHLPEMYEGKSVEDVIVRMKKRFHSAFDFEHTMAAGGNEITMKFPSCALGKVVTSRGEKIGQAVLCSLFHEYWAGLFGSFTGQLYNIEMLETGSTCTMRLQNRNA